MPQQLLRSLIVMRVKNWDYRELHQSIADGWKQRHFTLKLMSTVLFEA
jgi:transposase, IS5 family